MVDLYEREDLDVFVEQLAVPHRATRAYWHLRLSGPTALPAVRRGLRHDNASVRRQCCRILDRLADEDAYPDLIGMLTDPSPGVRIDALHALACDRCKENACPPAAGAILPRALDALAHDPNRYVRAMAVEVVGRWVHTERAAEVALVDAHARDPHPAVRKKAGWYVPGGTIHTRTRPKPPRV